MPANKSTFKSDKSLAMIDKIFAFMRERDSVTVGDMVGPVGTSNQQISQYLRHMEERGLVICAEPAVSIMGGSIPARWELVGSADQIEAELLERDTFPRQVIVRQEWEPNHARAPLDCAFFGVPPVLEAA